MNLLHNMVMQGCKLVPVCENQTWLQPIKLQHDSMRETDYADAAPIIARIDSLILVEFAAL